jgi:hypothetical protein
MQQYPLLSATAAGVLTCALNLPTIDTRGEELKYTIFTDNLFTSYRLFSTLRKLGIRACGTVRKGNFGSYFNEEIQDSNNGKILSWGEVRTHVETTDFKGIPGEEVLFFIWQDQKVVKGMTTVHDGLGYMLRNRRRPKDSSSMESTTKQIFQIPKTDRITQAEAKKCYSSKLALPVIQAIDDYNYNMNGVDLADQYREECSIAQITKRNWMVYFFWLIDSAIINAYILWKKEAQELVVGRQNEHMRTQRLFRESIIRHLLKDSPDALLTFRITVGKRHEFIRPNNQRIPLRFHQPQRGMGNTDCYLCRIKTLNGEGIAKEEHGTRIGCLVCEVPLCNHCWDEYHTL